MIALPANTRIWIAAGVTDMRRGFTGLSALVQTALEQDPLSGHVFQCPFDCTRHARRKPQSANHSPLSPSEWQAV
jgi:transposase